MLLKTDFSMYLIHMCLILDFKNSYFKELILQMNICPKLCADELCAAII